MAKVPRALAGRPDEYLRDLRALRKKNEPDGFTVLSEALFGQVSEWMSTGVLAIDKLMGGGWPMGRISEVAAWEGVIKSTLLDQSMAQCQRVGGVAALVDSEEARDIKWTAKLGADPKKIILGEASDIEESFEKIDKVIVVQEKRRAALKAEKSVAKVPPVLVVWDSLGGQPAREELEGKPADDHVSPAARVIKMNFRRIVGQLAENRITLVFANHFYKTIGGPASGHLVSYGGGGVRYYPSIRLWCSRIGNIKVGDSIVGHEVEVKLRKTKVGRPKPPITVGLVHGAGVDNAYTLYNWGKSHGIGGEYPDHRWVAERGRYRYLVVPGQPEPLRFDDGFLGLGRLLAENDAIYQVMAGAFLSAED